MPVSLAAIEDASRRIAGTALRTPLVRLNVAEAPAEIYLKLENLQPIGSFKIRGATNAMAHIGADQLRRGVLTASAGNMAQGVAWRARELGIPCTVVAPDTAPQARSISDADFGVAVSPAGAAGVVRPDTWADRAEVPDASTAATT